MCALATAVVTIATSKLLLLFTTSLEIKREFGGN